jgi:cystathionine beta-synthase
LTAYHALAEEILQQTKLSVDYVFVGVESGAMLTGIAQYLKNKIPGVKVNFASVIDIQIRYLN